MQRKVGFTMIETLLAIAIIAMLSGIGYAVSAPARESARQATCISNLRQIYTTWALYSADWPGMTYPNTEMSYISPSGHWEVFDAGKKHGHMFCPDAPAELKKTMTSSYAMHMSTDIWSNPEAPIAIDMRNELEKLGSLATGAGCIEHERHYYAPRETDVANGLSRRFEIRLRFDGSVAKVREVRR
jgi:prepilin-type N-terminal cleavage/methylation domain-containing protein